MKILRSLSLLFLLMKCSFLSAADILIKENEISPLYVESAVRLKPLKVNVFWYKGEGEGGVVHDWYVKTNSEPITKLDLASHCHVKEQLKNLSKEKHRFSPLNLSIVITVGNVEEEKSIENLVFKKDVAMTAEELMDYGFVH